jgi:gluconate:H+ symporter, GntP family
MAEVGLLIGFGVLLGSLLIAMGALQNLVELLLRLLGPRRLPYAFSAVLSTIFPAIYVDVQLVLATPLARSAAPRMSRVGLAMMGGTLTVGILVGYVFVVPGLGTVAIAGLLGVPLGTMLIYGTLIGPQRPYSPRSSTASYLSSDFGTQARMKRTMRRRRKKALP